MGQLGLLWQMEKVNMVGGKKRAAVSRISSNCSLTTEKTRRRLRTKEPYLFEFWKVLPGCPGQLCATTGSILINKAPSGVCVT